MTGVLPPEWQPTDKDRELLHRDYERAGIERGTEDPVLVATIAAFIGRGADR